jgi:hypothetical protein
VLSAIRALYEREISLADTVEQIERIRVAYLGKNGIIKRIEGVLWKPIRLKRL